MHPKSGNISFDFLKPEHGDSELSPERLFKFVRDWRATTLVDHIITQKETPESEKKIFKDSLIQNFHGHEFDEKVIFPAENHVTDTLLYFYSPNCKHCKKFNHKIEIIYLLIKDNPKL